MNKYLEIQEFLQHYFDIFNERFFSGELPKVVITVASKGRKKDVKGWLITDKVWIDGEEKSHELNISAEYLSLGTVDMLATLLHNMIHLHATEKGIREVSRNLTVHNKKFKSIAEGCLLEVEHDKKAGFGITTATPDLERLIKSIPIYKEFQIHRSHDLVVPTDKPKSYSYFCGTCDTKFKSPKDYYQLRCLVCESDLICEEND